MMLHGYELRAYCVKHKYEKFAEDWKDEVDDRRLVVNCYHIIIDACEEMADCEIDNNFICVAVNAKIDEREKMMDRIIERFTGLQYKKFKWRSEADVEMMEVGVL